VYGVIAMQLKDHRRDLNRLAILQRQPYVALADALQEARDLMPNALRFKDPVDHERAALRGGLDVQRHRPAVRILRQPGVHEQVAER
jgi:hypothetical protein